MVTFEKDLPATWFRFQNPDVVIGSGFVEKVLPLIAASRESIKIIVYDWRLYRDQESHPVSKLTRALHDAALRGVEVKVLITNENVKRELLKLGFNCKIIYSQKLVHAKMMLIDDAAAIVGSHNYTQSAFTQNLEVSLIAYFDSQQNALREYFDRLWPL